MKRVSFLLILFLLIIYGCANSKSMPPTSLVKESVMSEEISVESNQIIQNNDYEYKVINKSVTLIKYKGHASEVVIPDTIEGHPVKVIGEDSFKSNADLESVIVSNYVTIIEKSAFQDCKYLKSVSLGNNLKEIGGFAFNGSINLKSLILPKSLIKIGIGAFSFSAIEKMIFPVGIKSIPGGIFDSAAALKEVVLSSQCECIAAEAFRSVTGLHEIYIPDSVKDISPSAFDECSRELVLLYDDNNLLVPHFAQEQGILSMKKTEYTTVLTVGLVNGKPLNDEKNTGINKEDYNLVKRRTLSWTEQHAMDDYEFAAFERYISNEYITFWYNENLSNENVKAKLMKTAMLLFQCGITNFDPTNLNQMDIDKMATFAIYSRSNEEIKEDDEIGDSAVLFADDEMLILHYWGFFDIKPDFEKITGYSQQQHGIWYYPKKFPPVEVETVSFSGDAEKLEYTLKLRFASNNPESVEKTFSFKLVEHGTVGGDRYRVILTRIY